MNKNAFFDKTKRYRFLLTREWQNNSMRITWIMLNPSTADETVDDPTIKRCIGFSKRWGAGHMEIVNLFAYRSTNPKTLYTVENPIGEENDSFILQSAKKANIIIVAWGIHGKLHNRSKYVVNELLKDFQNKIFTLKLLKNNEPAHPLYIPYTETLKQFNKKGVHGGIL